MLDSDVEFLTLRFEEMRQRTAFIDNNETFTYGWILDNIPKYEEWMSTKGIARGDVIVWIADYSPQAFCFLLAGIRRGVIIAPITSSSVVEIDSVLEISECRWIVYFATNILDIAVEGRECTTTNELVNDFALRGHAGLLLFSSGSTGQPKGILLDAHAVMAKFRKPRAPIVAISFLMLDHFGGINTLLHVTSCLGTVVTIKDRTVASICGAIEQHHVEVLPATPSFLNLLVHSDPWGRFDLSSLRIISYGTEVMPQPTLDRLRAMFPGVSLRQTYGLSEVGVLRSSSRPDGSLWVKIGGEGFDTKVIDGVLWVRSDYAMVGYLNQPSPFDDEGWFNTQDRVEVDGDYLRILGRTTDLINVGGQKVYPSEIEDVIMRVENVVDVRVFGEPNPLLGNVVVAEVRTRKAEEVQALKKRIRRACATELAPFKVPTRVMLTTQSLYTARQKKMRSNS